jgi:hypothetical protein
MLLFKVYRGWKNSFLVASLYKFGKKPTSNPADLALYFKVVNLITNGCTNYLADLNYNK